MVYHMTDGPKGLQRPPVPPVCPKCGSHRTQIVGIYDEASTINIRCGTCGEVSRVPAPGADAKSDATAAAALPELDEEGVA
jgi:transcription elongation factor Elf1